jgi:hypothetical protein
MAEFGRILHFWAVAGQSHGWDVEMAERDEEVVEPRASLGETNQGLG